MYQHQLHQKIKRALEKNALHANPANVNFYTRFVANAAAIESLFSSIYQHHPAYDLYFNQLVETIVDAHQKEDLLYSNWTKKSWNKKAGS